jgi:hypothetical protein
MVLPRVIQCELRRNSAQRVAFCHPSLNGDLSRPTAEAGHTHSFAGFEADPCETSMSDPV